MNYIRNHYDKEKNKHHGYFVSLINAFNSIEKRNPSIVCL